MASIQVHVPVLLRPCVGGRSSVEIEAATLEEVTVRLKSDYPSLYAHLFQENGVRRVHVALFLNKENLTSRFAEHISLSTGDEISILQAVSGG
jgi:sulfur carrier protein ThiS